MQHVARILALLLGVARLAAAGQPSFQGLRLDEALRLLQHRGLPIVYSSEIVTASMRVTAEPRATDPRKKLDELLEPHGLRAEAGPGRVILIVRERQPRDHSTAKKQKAAVRKDASEESASAATSAAGYVDHVTVRGWGEGPDRGASEMTFDRSTLRTTKSVLEGDGLRSLHSMPRVAGEDDFRNEFSVRGSPPRHVGIVIDGVSTPWLQHSLYGRRDAGSLSMFGSDILESATLQAGAYPRRFDDTLGAQLELTLREGSRDATHIAGTAGGMSAAVLGEGPIGGAGHGSWIAGVRNSYRAWPPRKLTPDDSVFAFADAHAKAVYDIRPTQQLSVTALAGRSVLDAIDEPLVGPLSDGTTRAGLVTMGWRSLAGAHTVIRQRVSLVGQELSSTTHTGQTTGRALNRAFTYQGEALHGLFGGLLETGTEVSRVSGSREIAAATSAAMSDALRRTWTTRSVYANFTHTAPGGVWLEAGVRASDSTLVHQRAFAPWILGAWRFRPGWTLNASAGASRQFPGLDDVLGTIGLPDIAPERATHLDVGIEQLLPSGIKWQLTLFNRIENEVLRGPDARLLETNRWDVPSVERYRSPLHGVSRGIEVFAAPPQDARLSGWISYTYGIALQSDITTREAFWSDYDRRHIVNASGTLQIARQTRASVVLRAASGLPIPGYFTIDNGTLVVGERRNGIRLDPYVRLDARVQRTFFSSRHAVTVLGEALNAFNRRNWGVAEGVVRPGTGEAIGFTRPLLPRRASIGLAIDLGR